MQVIDVIVLSDEATPSLDSWSDRRGDVNVEFRLVDLPRLDTIEAYHAAVTALTRTRECVVVLDLQYEALMDASDEVSELRTFAQAGHHWLPPRVRGTWPRAVLAGYLMKVLSDNHNWSGLLAISTNYCEKGSTGERHLVQSLKERMGSPGTRRVVLLRARVDSTPDLAVQEARRYQMDMLAPNPIPGEAAWYLEAWQTVDPPGEPWFLERRYHTPGHGAERHLALVRERFPGWQAHFRDVTSELEAAKALLYSGRRYRKTVGGERLFVASALEVLFPGLMYPNGADRDHKLLLPVAPGFPFLIAAKTVLYELCTDWKLELVRCRTNDVADRLLMLDCCRPDEAEYHFILRGEAEPRVDVAGLKRAVQEGGARDTRQRVRDAVEAVFDHYEWIGERGTNGLAATLTERMASCLVRPFFDVPERQVGFAWPHAWYPSDVKEDGS